MNTIQITTVDGPVNYTEAEVVRYIEKAGQVDILYKDIRNSQYKVRDFFSELEWSEGEATVQRHAVNELLISIGCDKLRTKWSATVTIEATVSGYTAEDEDDASECIEQDIDVSIGSGADISIEVIDVSNVQEEE
jgi:hypothetical protein